MPFDVCLFSACILLPLPSSAKIPLHWKKPNSQQIFNSTSTPHPRSDDKRQKVFSSANCINFHRKPRKKTDKNQFSHANQTLVTFPSSLACCRLTLPSTSARIAIPQTIQLFSTHANDAEAQQCVNVKIPERVGWRALRSRLSDSMKKIFYRYIARRISLLFTLSLVKAKWRGRQQTPLWNVVYKVCEGKVMDFSFTQPKWAQREAAENRETFSHTEKLTSERESRKWIDNFITSHSHMWDRWKSVNGMCQRLTVQLCASFGAPKSHFPTHSAHPRCVYTKRIFHMYSYIVSHYHRLCSSFWGIASFGVGDFYTHSTTLVKRERESEKLSFLLASVWDFSVFSFPLFHPLDEGKQKKSTKQKLLIHASQSCKNFGFGQTCFSRIATRANRVEALLFSLLSFRSLIILTLTRPPLPLRGERKTSLEKSGKIRQLKK